MALVLMPYFSSEAAPSSPVSEYKTYAELGAASLLKYGISTNAIQAVPAPWVPKDRTYAAAESLEKWFADHEAAPVAVNLLTIGPHARRSRLLYRKALGKRVKVGVMSIPIRDYDAKHWWR